jgi:hypothetical protein
MKTIIFKPIIFSFLFISFISLFVDCKKDTNCIAVITVRKQSDTSIVVPNATVLLNQNHGNLPSTTNIQGVTDLNGQFTHTFPLPAILNVTVTYNGTPDTLRGIGVIQLIVGGTATKTIFVQ